MEKKKTEGKLREKGLDMQFRSKKAVVNLVRNEDEQRLTRPSSTSARNFMYVLCDLSNKLVREK